MLVLIVVGFFISTSHGAKIPMDQGAEPVNGPGAIKARVGNFLKDVNCGVKPGIPPLDKFIDGINKCIYAATNATKNNELCLFPCIAKEIGLISSNGTFQSSNAMDLLNEQYPPNLTEPPVEAHDTNGTTLAPPPPLDAPRRAKWVELLQVCFQRYAESGHSLHTDVHQCNANHDKGQQDALEELGKCFILSRDCGNKAARAKGRNMELATTVLDTFGSFMPGAQVLLEAKSLLNRLMGMCSVTAWCNWKGYCSAYCGAFLDQGDWCYTSSETYMFLGNSVWCREHADCDPCWKCSGTCSSNWIVG